MAIEAKDQGVKQFTIAVTDGAIEWLGSPNNAEDAKALIQSDINSREAAGTANPDTVYYTFEATEFLQVVV